MLKVRGDEMSVYIEPIRFAFLFFPFIAFLFTLPYLFHQYHKYGSVLLRRAVIVYSFILYLICIYFLVILPLPSREYVQSLSTEWVQLTPFAFVRDFILKSSFIWNDPSTYLTALKEEYFYQVFYNILLTIPFGIYLRYYFNCSFKKTFILTFLLTLFFEGTQLSGLYGIYPRPYRLFDIDDLFLNTLGGIIGYGITPLLSHFMPDRKTLDELSYRKGKKISILRRSMASWIDLFSVGVITFLLSLIGIKNFFLQYIFSIILIFMIVPIFCKGYTFGKNLMNIKLVSLEENEAKWYQYVIRYGILYLLFLPIPFYFLFIISIFGIYNINTFIFLALLFVIAVFSFLFFLHFCYSLFTKKLFWYERLSQTKNISTIVVEVEDEEYSSATM